MSRDERERRQYFLGLENVPIAQGKTWSQQNTYENKFFMNQVPSNTEEEGFMMTMTMIMITIMTTETSIRQWKLKSNF